MADHTLKAEDDTGIALTASGTDDKIGLDLTNLVEESSALADTARIIIEKADGTPYYMTVANLKSLLGVPLLERGTFVNADLSGGVLTISHTLGQQYVVLLVWDNNDELLWLVEVDCSASNTVTVDLSDFTPLSGTWRYLVMG